jgi:hypothetical protein
MIKHQIDQSNIAKNNRIWKKAQSGLLSHASDSDEFEEKVEDQKVDKSQQYLVVKPRK